MIHFMNKPKHYMCSFPNNLTMLRRKPEGFSWILLCSMNSCFRFRVQIELEGNGKSLDVVYSVCPEKHFKYSRIQTQTFLISPNNLPHWGNSIHENSWPNAVISLLNYNRLDWKLISMKLKNLWNMSGIIFPIEQIIACWTLCQVVSSTRKSYRKKFIFSSVGFSVNLVD